MTFRPRHGGPVNAVRRAFELFATESWYDKDGNVIQSDYCTVVQENMDFTRANKPGAQLTFDEWLENEVMWNHHLSAAEEEEPDAEDF